MDQSTIACDLGHHESAFHGVGISGASRHKSFLTPYKNGIQSQLSASPNSAHSDMFTLSPAAHQSGSAIKFGNSSTATLPPAASAVKANNENKPENSSFTMLSGTLTSLNATSSSGATGAVSGLPNAADYNLSFAGTALPPLLTAGRNTASNNASPSGAAGRLPASAAIPEVPVHNIRRNTNLLFASLPFECDDGQLSNDDEAGRPLDLPSSLPLDGDGSRSVNTPPPSQGLRASVKKSLGHDTSPPSLGGTPNASKASSPQHRPQQQPEADSAPVIARALYAPDVLTSEEHAESVTLALGDLLLRKQCAVRRRKVSHDYDVEFASSHDDESVNSGSSSRSHHSATLDVEEAIVAAKLNAEEAVCMPLLAVTSRELHHEEISSLRVSRHVEALEMAREQNVVSQMRQQQQSLTQPAPLQESSLGNTLTSTNGSSSPSPTRAGGTNSGNGMASLHPRIQSSLTTHSSCDDLTETLTNEPSEVTRREFGCMLATPLVPEGNVKDVYNQWVLRVSPTVIEREEVLRHLLQAVVEKVAILHGEGRCHGSIKASNIFCTTHVITAILRIIDDAKQRAIDVNGADPEYVDGAEVAKLSPTATAFVKLYRTDQDTPPHPHPEWFRNVVLTDGGFHELEHVIDGVPHSLSVFTAEKLSSASTSAPHHSDDDDDNSIIVRRQDSDTSNWMERRLQWVDEALHTLSSNEMSEMDLYGVRQYEYIPPPEALDLSKRVTSSTPLSSTCRSIASPAADVWNIGLLAIHLADGGFPAWLRRQQTPTPSLQRSVWSKNFFSFVQSCNHTKPALRPTAAALLQSAWFAAAVNTSVNAAVHRTDTNVSGAVSAAAGAAKATAGSLHEISLDQQQPSTMHSRSASILAGGRALPASGRGVSTVPGTSRDAGVTPNAATLGSICNVHLRSFADLHMEESRRKKEAETAKAKSDAIRTATLPYPAKEASSASKSSKDGGNGHQKSASTGGGGNPAPHHPNTHQDPTAGLPATANGAGPGGNGDGQPPAGGPPPPPSGNDAVPPLEDEDEECPRFVAIDRMTLVLDEVRENYVPTPPRVDSPLQSNMEDDFIETVDGDDSTTDDGATTARSTYTAMSTVRGSFRSIVSPDDQQSPTRHRVESSQLRAVREAMNQYHLTLPSNEENDPRAAYDERLEERDAALAAVTDAFLELHSTNEGAMDVFFASFIEAMAQTDDTTEYVDELKITSPTTMNAPSSVAVRTPSKHSAATTGANTPGSDAFPLPKKFDQYVKIGPQPNEFANYSFCKWRVLSAETMRLRARRLADAKLK